MLTKEEALKVAEICDTWPGGLGCILIPSTRSRRGYVTANWGWRGHIPGNFDYSKIQTFKDEQQAVCCPVTEIGVMRGANGFKGHMDAYNAIKCSLLSITNYNEEEVKKQYNFLLSRQPKTLAALFRCYANDEKVKSCSLKEIVEGYFVHFHHVSEGNVFVSLAYISGSGNSYVETAEGKRFRRNGRSATGSIDFITAF